MTETLPDVDRPILSLTYTSGMPLCPEPGEDIVQHWLIPVSSSAPVDCPEHGHDCPPDEEDCTDFRAHYCGCADSSNRIGMVHASVVIPGTVEPWRSCNHLGWGGDWPTVKNMILGPKNQLAAAIRENLAAPDMPIVVITGVMFDKEWQGYGLESVAVVEAADYLSRGSAGVVVLQRPDAPYLERITEDLQSLGYVEIEPGTLVLDLAGRPDSERQELAQARMEFTYQRTSPSRMPLVDGEPKIESAAQESGV